MWITKRGDPKRSSRLREFVCEECGAEWFAGPHEVYKNIAGLESACYCPECHELTREKRSTEAKAVCQG